MYPQSATSNTHVREERTMDNANDNGANEEEK